MKITIDHLDDLHMEAQNDEGGLIRMDGTTEIGGLEGGFSPMQLLLAGVGGCSAIDIIGILKKQKQDLQDLKVEVDGDRQSKGTYSEFTTIHINYIFTGDLDEKKVERAINLSLDKYCSVTKTLEKTSKITHSYEIKSN
ncbi:osmotically inducible protein OsmC [Aliifodinibius salipaludis]|uniref:Osmotically inducible protein OsmC n=1 Tax=Fodinibius salipaludis TaxID=2032627 RepID=A0A2A2GA01_9BACT|nr:OsmC family protein [Aliifodinibius salipaludis]PAU93679.1 osmotically inducible protein OsmC [Aliifodinibius salipaludis]